MRVGLLGASVLCALASALPQAESTSASNTTATSTTSSAASTCSGNDASSRTSWCDYDISTDYTTIVPDTGVVREYWFDLQDGTASPDGIERYVQTINGSVPGPTIYGDWGDTVRVHLTNSLSESTNGTSIHFHGIRQNYTNQNDGVVSLTQCPVAVGGSMTYEFRLTQYGSSWYHSHYGLQAWEGLFGGILINGPATANYDEDLGHVFLNDWDHQTVDELWDTAESSGPPTLDTGLLNGTNIYNNSGTIAGERLSFNWTSGTSYCLRFVNAAVDSHYKVMVDNHTMTVIAADLVTIEPYETTVLNMGMGQRYDVTITANQGSVASDFWMRAIAQSACSENDNPTIRGILHSDGSTDTPSTYAYSYTDKCVDESISDLVPYVAKTMDIGTNLTEEVTVGINSDSLFRWYMNSTSMSVEWADPTLKQVYNDDTSFTNTSGVVQLDAANQWYFIVIETSNTVPYAIYLHGHDFSIVAQGTGSWDGSISSTTNPPRRDTAMLPASGHLVLGFETDNPGAWLMHCHIGWHTSEGFAIQILERYTELQDLIDYDSLNSTCSAWTTYAAEASATSNDSEI